MATLQLPDYVPLRVTDPNSFTETIDGVNGDKTFNSGSQAIIFPENSSPSVALYAPSVSVTNYSSYSSGLMDLKASGALKLVPFSPNSASKFAPNDPKAISLFNGTLSQSFFASGPGGWRVDPTNNPSFEAGGLVLSSPKSFDLNSANATLGLAAADLKLPYTYTQNLTDEVIPYLQPKTFINPLGRGATTVPEISQAAKIDFSKANTFIEGIERLSFYGKRLNVDGNLPNLFTIGEKVVSLKNQGLSDQQIQDQYLTGIKNRYEAVISAIKLPSQSLTTLNATGEKGAFRPFAQGTSPTANLTLTPGAPSSLQTTDYFPLKEVNFTKEMTFGNNGKPFGLDLTLQEAGVTYKDGTLTLKGKGESRISLLNTVLRQLTGSSLGSLGEQGPAFTYNFNDPRAYIAINPKTGDVKQVARIGLKDIIVPRVGSINEASGLVDPSEKVIDLKGKITINALQGLSISGEIRTIDGLPDKLIAEADNLNAPIDGFFYLQRIKAGVDNLRDPKRPLTLKGGLGATLGPSIEASSITAPLKYIPVVGPQLASFIASKLGNENQGGRVDNFYSARLDGDAAINREGVAGQLNLKLLAGLIKPATVNTFVNFKTKSAGLKTDIDLLGLQKGEGFARLSFSPQAQISVGLRGGVGALLKPVVGEERTSSLFEYSKDGNSHNDYIAFWGQKTLPPNPVGNAIQTGAGRLINFAFRKQVVQDPPKFITDGFRLRFDGTSESLRSNGEAKPEKVRTLDNTFNSVSNGITNEVTRQLSSVGQKQKAPKPVSKLQPKLDSPQDNGSISNEVEPQLSIFGSERKVPTPVSKLQPGLDSLQSNVSISNEVEQALDFVGPKRKVPTPVSKLRRALDVTTPDTGSLEPAVESEVIPLQGSEELLPAIDPNAVVIDDTLDGGSNTPITQVENPTSDLFNLDELESQLNVDADKNGDGVVNVNDYVDEDGIGVDYDGVGGVEDDAVEVPASAGSEATFRISGSNTDYAEFRVGWQFSSVERPKFEIVAPDGKIYNSDDPSEVAIFTGNDDSPDYAKVLIDEDTTNSRQLEVIVMEPEAGAWTIRMTDTTALGMVEYSAELPSAKPTLDIGKPTFDPTTGQVTIPYEASDADSSMTVKFYYDSDGEGGDGVPISDEIVLGSGSSSSQFVWNATDLPSEHPYIFARVEDANSPPVVVYTDEPVEIVEAGALPAVQNVGASWFDGNEVEVSWDGIPEAQSYLVTYSSNASHSDDQEEKTVEVAGGLNAIILSDLTPGETYRITVQAVDAEDDYSPESVPALATVGEFTGSDITNDTPDREEWSVFAQPGTTYTEDLSLKDVVEVEAIDIPEGAELNLETGKLTWAVPANAQPGWHEFDIKLTDVFGNERIETFEVFTGTPKPAALDAFDSNSTPTLTSTPTPTLTSTPIPIPILPRIPTLGSTPTPTPTPTPTGSRVLTPSIPIPDPNTNLDSSFSGGSENDTLFGTEGADVIDGLEGNDVIYSVGAADNVLGGAGDDSLSGGEGNDFVDAGGGSDTVFGGKGNDSVLGGFDSDSLFGDRDNDLVLGGDGDDVIFGGKNNDSLNGDAGNDSIFGQLDNDFIIGGSGNDFINGDNGDDTLVGVNPAAVKPGVDEFDTLFGGIGRDLFVLGDTEKIYYEGNGNAFISDFNSVSNMIQLSGAKENYLLVVSGDTTNIFLTKQNQGDDLIATIERVSNLSINESYFTFV